MDRLTNNSGIGLALAVWLAHDEYDNGAGSVDAPEGELISVTSLLKPTRQFVLAQRVPPEDRVLDVLDMSASRFGHAMHSSIENAWEKGYRNAMTRLGYPQKVIDSVRINPEVEEEGAINVYLEQRYFRKADGVVISGQFDEIINGELNDTKTTSVYAYINGSKEEDHQRQGSIYRWINPEKVTSDIMRIQFIFTDWRRSEARINPEKYPQNRVHEHKIQLLSLTETENFIKEKLREIRANINLPEKDIVRCTDKELWKSDPVYKYYSDPAKAQSGGRSTKNFSNLQEAHSHQAKVGKGVVITVPGQVRACGYCPAFSICTQKDEYEHERT